ncbi:MAG: PEGA domain-containing protein [Alistipes sp.]|nr:PEGA domain-containing protein [Alistipes sp.]
MKQLIILLLSIIAPVVVMAQMQRSLEIDAQSFAPVQQGALTGVAIDKIQPDHSKRPCARIKLRINRMSRADIDQLSVKIVGGNIALMRREVATEGNGLILEMTAKEQTRFYLHHDKYGDSNEVTLNLEGNKEYRLNAELSVQQSIIINGGVEGAEIYLDGEYKGITNSAAELTMEGITMGSHKVRVVHGSAVTERDIEVTTTSIHFRVEVNTAQSQPQWVVLQVEPKEATVTIDKKMYIPDTQGIVELLLPNDTYSYTISAKDYYTESSTFVVAGTKLQSSISLRPAHGWLSTPESEILHGAAVFVDDENIGTAPIKEYKLASGQHRVRMIQKYYEVYEQNITIDDGVTFTLSPTLVADYVNVTLDAGTSCDIYANNQLLGTSPWSGKLSQGSYIFETRKEGHSSMQLSQTLTREPMNQQFTLPAPTPIYGTITVRSTPSLAHVLIDGKEIGTTPLTENIIIGKHKLSIVADGYTTYEKEIVVTKGGSEEISVPLKARSVAAVAQTPTSSSSGNARKNAYKVGDYYDDGTKQGIVFYVDATGQHGKIVSLDQVEKQWCSSAQFDKGIVVGASSESDGKANTDKVMSRSDSAEYSAFVWCRAKGKDWYLPAIDELKLLLLDSSVHEAVNRTLKKHRGDALFSIGEHKCYWPSTEYNEFCAWGVYMIDGGTDYLNKNYYRYVRAVSAF